jgi:hypothetical protein
MATITKGRKVESMTATLTTVACFAGVFALAFGLAGFFGLADAHPKRPEPPTLLDLLDYGLTGGVFALLQSMAMNWSSRPDERRSLLIGVACGVICVAAVAVIGQLG